MTLKLSKVRFFYVNHANVSVRASNCYGFGIFIEGATVSDDITDVNSHDFLDHSNIPDLENTIRVTRTNILSTDRELSVINRVQMSIEGLYSKSSSHIPDR